MTSIALRFFLVWLWAMSWIISGVAGAYEGAGVSRERAPRVKPAPRLTKPPAVIKFIEATYPDQELAEKKSAEVVMLIDIDAAGRVTQVEITGSGGEPFDQAARQALLQFVFSPAEMDGKPAAVRIEYVYRFTAPPVPAPAPEPVQKPVNLSGYVRQRGTREPIGGANVYLPQHDLAAESDQRGYFEIRGVPPGPAKVEISQTGYKKFETTVEINDQQTTELTAYLWKTLGDEFQTVVHGDREKKEVAQRTLEKEELTTVPGTFGDPLRVLNNMPGVARVPYGLGTLLVRGAQPQDTSVYLDGVPVPLLYHFGGGPSVVSPSFIDKIDFIPGAYSAKYGRAIAGIVDVSSKSSPPTGYHGTVKIDVLDAGFYVEGPLRENKKYGSLTLAARRSFVDLFLPLIIKNMRQAGKASISAVPYFWDYQARYAVDIGANQLELSAFGSNDQLTVIRSGDAQTQPFSLDAHQGFNRVQLRWSRHLASGWKLSLAPSYGTTISTFNSNDIFAGSNGSWNLSLRTAAKKELAKWLSLEIGTDLIASFYTIRYQIAREAGPGETTAPPPLVRVQHIRNSSYASYMESIWSPFPWWKVIPGLRLEIYDLPNRWAPSLEPRLASRWPMIDWLTVKAAWGIFRQAPQPHELSSESGNPYLGLLSSQQVVAGMEIKPLPSRLAGLMLDVQGFYNWRNNLVTSSTDYVTRDGKVTLERLNNSGHGRSYGLEVLLKHDLTERFYGWVAYTLSHSKVYNHTADRYEPSLFDQTHILTVVGSYRLESWQFGARFQLTSGRPETPIIGSTFDADRGRYLPLNGVANSSRGATFSQLDLRVEKLWTFQTWKLSTYLDVQNVYNAQNPELTLWDYRYRQNTPLRGLPFLPTLGIAGEF